jgi:hypothetical protein
MSISNGVLLVKDSSRQQRKRIVRLQESTKEAAEQEAVTRTAGKRVAKAQCEEARRRREAEAVWQREAEAAKQRAKEKMQQRIAEQLRLRAETVCQQACSRCLSRVAGQLVDRLLCCYFRQSCRLSHAYFVSCMTF